MRGILLAITLAFAHPENMPVRPTWGSPEMGFGAAIGGYGYYGQSEAEAHQALEFGCTPDDQRRYVAQACHTAIPSAADPRGLVTDAMRSLLLQRIREHEFEWVAVQLAALSSDRSPTAAPALPACMQPNQALNGLFASLPATQPSDVDVARAPTPERKQLLGKMRVAGNTLTSGNLLRASLLYDSLAYQKQRFCGGPNDMQTSFCIDVTNQIQRVEASFPALFASSAREHQATPLMAYSEAERSPLTQAVHELLGARLPAATTQDARRARGAAIYQSGVQAGGASAIPALERQIAEAANEARHPAAGTSPDVASAMASALALVNRRMDEARANHKIRLVGRLSRLCDQSLSTLVSNEPNIVRQVLTDMSPDERAMSQAALCQTRGLASARRLDVCQGVTTTSDANGVRTSVQRTNWTYPYASALNYRIDHPSAPAGAPPTVSSVMRIVVDGDVPDGDAKVAAMQRQAQTFFACEVGQVSSISGVPGLNNVASCPRDPAMRVPPVRFNITFEAIRRLPDGRCQRAGGARIDCNSIEQPRVNLHRCFRAELPAPQNSSCDQARRFNVEECSNTIRMWQRQGVVGGAARWGMNLDTLLDNISMPSMGGSQASPGGGPSPAPSLTPDQVFAQRVSAPAACARPANVLTASSQALQAFCDCRTPPVGDPRNNRENSGNYSNAVDAPTVLHEVGHVLGLPDEYVDPTYPISPVGEHDSMMNGSGPSSRFYPRHLRQILQPERCSP